MEAILQSPPTYFTTPSTIAVQHTLWKNVNTISSTAQETSLLTLTSGVNNGSTGFRSNQIFNTTTLPITVAANIGAGTKNVGNAAANWDDTLLGSNGRPKNAYFTEGIDVGVSGTALKILQW